MTTDKYTPGPRRQVVLSMLREGWSVRVIAEALGISTQRVRQHQAALRQKGLLPKGEER